MKQIVLITTFLATSLFANYAYTGENSGKIDMHGGKGESLLGNNKKFTDSNFNSLGNIGIMKPKSPTKPAELIKKEKKNIEDKTDLNTIK